MSDESALLAKLALLDFLNEFYAPVIPGLKFMEMDEAAFVASNASPNRPVNWDWRDMFRRFVTPNRYAIGIAVWWSEPATGAVVLSGMMIIDIPDSATARLRFLEALPQKYGVLHKNACKIAMAAVEFYAILLKVACVKIDMAIEGTVKYYERNGYKHIGEAIVDFDGGPSYYDLEKRVP